VGGDGVNVAEEKKRGGEGEDAAAGEAGGEKAAVRGGLLPLLLPLALLLLLPPLAPKTFSPAYLTYRKPSSSFDCSKTSASEMDVGGSVNVCSSPSRFPNPFDDFLFVFLVIETKTKRASAGDMPIRRLITKTSCPTVRLAGIKNLFLSIGGASPHPKPSARSTITGTRSGNFSLIL